MKNGLYSVTTKGFDGVDWPPGGVFFLQNGVLLGGSSFMYYIGSYTCDEGIFKGECVAKPHTPPPASHLYFEAEEVGVGLTSSYEGDQAELTGTVFFGKKKPYASPDLAEISGYLKNACNRWRHRTFIPVYSARTPRHFLERMQNVATSTAININVTDSTATKIAASESSKPNGRQRIGASRH